MFVGEGILYDAMHARHESVIILTMCSSLFSQYELGLRGGAPTWALQQNRVAHRYSAVFKK